MSDEEHPLFFYYASETTGLDPLKDHIIEMGSTVPVDVEENEFTRLVSTTKEIPESAYRVHGLTSRDLKGQESFPAVVKEFLKWIKRTVKKASAAEGLNYYPVLVAHNGGLFHFRVMAAEMARHKLSFKKHFKRRRVAFADSLECLREVKKSGSSEHIGPKLPLDLPSLHKKFLPKEVEVSNAKRRALPFARKLKRLFTRSPLKSLRGDLQTVSYRKVRKDYRRARNAREMGERFSTITREQATKLAQSRLSIKKLQSIYEEEERPLDFDETVQKKGIKSSALRNKLYVHLSNEKRE